MKTKRFIEKSVLIRIFSGLACFAVLIFCSINIAKAIEHNQITVANTTGDIEVINNNINNLTITPTLVFNKTGDSITYQMTLRSTSDSSFQIKNVSDDNNSPFFTTSYQYDDTNSADEKTLLVTLSYNSYVPLGDTLNLDDIHITMDVEETENQNPSGNPDDNPSTNPDDNPSGNPDDNPSDNPSGNPNDDPSTEDPDDEDIKIPDTGALRRKTVEVASSNDGDVLPFIIIGIIALAIIFTILPTSKKHRITFDIISFIVLASTISGWNSTKSFADTSQIQITIVGANISAKPDTQNPKNVVSAIFPNIYNTPEIKAERDVEKPAAGNAIILKTLDDKYVLMDTGPGLTTIQNAIYNNLKELQGTNKVTIDYLIISHLDGDHYGNAVTFMNQSEKYNIQNIVFKHEIYESNSKESVFQSIANAAAANNIHIITSGDATTTNYLAGKGVTDYEVLSEGMIIPVGRYLNLDFFNTTNVYEGKSCPDGNPIDWRSDITDSSIFKTPNGEYIYIDGSEYQTSDSTFSFNSAKYPFSDVTFRTTTNLKTKPNGSGINKYYYAAKLTNRSFCQSNPNSFGILAEIVTANEKRYMYFTGDIENAGYSTLSSGANSSQTYSAFAFQNGDFINNITPYTIPAEDDTAAAIYDKLAADATAQGKTVESLLNNIVLYQMSHHGENNSEKAVWKLNLNRSSGIYAIQDGFVDLATSPKFRLNKTYHYTLGNIPAENKIGVWAKDTDTKKNGVNCTVNAVGATTCERY